MERHDFEIPVTFTHRVIFTREAFATENKALAEVLKEGGGPPGHRVPGNRRRGLVEGSDR